MAKGGLKPGPERWMLASSQGPLRYKTGTIMVFVSKEKAFSYVRRYGQAGIRYDAINYGNGNF